MQNIDVTNTTLILNAILAVTAVMTIVLSAIFLWWQLRHQRQFEIRRLQQQYIMQMLEAIARPQRVAEGNVIEAVYVRTSSLGGVLDHWLQLQEARPDLSQRARDVVTDFYIAKDTFAAIIPACSTSVQPSKEFNKAFDAAKAELAALENAYVALMRKFGVPSHLVSTTVDELFDDPNYVECDRLIRTSRGALAAMLVATYR